MHRHQNDVEMSQMTSQSDARNSPAACRLIDLILNFKFNILLTYNVLLCILSVCSVTVMQFVMMPYVLSFKLTN